MITAAAPATRPVRRSAPAGLTLEQFAHAEAAILDAVAADATRRGEYVSVRPAVARRIARALRALATLSREAA